MSDITEFKSSTGMDIDAIKRSGYGEVRYGPPESDMMVVFYPKSVLNQNKSQSKGKPVFESRDFVKIQHPGETLNIIDREATEIDKRKYRNQWAAYLEGKEQIPEGIPLNLLFPHQPQIVDMLRQYKIVIVEQLAKLTAHGIETIGLGALDWVQKAQNYLKQAEKGVDFHKFEKAMHEKDSQIATLTRQLNEMQAMIAQITSAKEGKPVSVPDGFKVGNLPDLSKHDVQSEMIANTMKSDASQEPVMFTQDIGKKRGRPKGSKNKAQNETA